MFFSFLFTGKGDPVNMVMKKRQTSRKGICRRMLNTCKGPKVNFQDISVFTPLLLR